MLRGTDANHVAGVGTLCAVAFKATDYGLITEQQEQEPSGSPIKVGREFF